MKEQILIVEDEQDTAELLRYNLDKAGYATMIARNGEAAIDAVQFDTPDLVLLAIKAVNTCTSGCTFTFSLPLSRAAISPETITPDTGEA